MSNLITLTDSYKLSHFNQYPEGTEIVHSYLMSRGGEYEDIVFHGLPYILKEYLEKGITGEDIEEGEKLASMHGVPFNKEGWNYILSVHNGKLPIIINALEDGTITKPNVPLLTIENTDPKCAWLVGYLETLILKVWYPTTVASKSYFVRKLLEKHYNESSDDISGVDFAYHNFGDRGSSSVEAAAIGGVAHLTQFKGTDNFNCLIHSKKYYRGKYAGMSIPASEHSTVTSWGRENEYKMIANYLETYKSSYIIACVLDSYDIYKAVDFVTSGAMKYKIESNDYPIFVIRPDSGDMMDVMIKILQIMNKNGVKKTRNSKGYVVFDKYRIIWGDGITPAQIDKFLTAVTKIGYSATNFAFGSGGDIMQNVTRDTCKFAIKCSAIKVNGEWKDVYKDPITDQGKKSLKGRIEGKDFVTVFHNGLTLWDR
jgi:nicotinamide phosphoribosyltransferase